MGGNVAAADVAQIIAFAVEGADDPVFHKHPANREWAVLWLAGEAGPSLNGRDPTPGPQE